MLDLSLSESNYLVGFPPLLCFRFQTFYEEQPDNAELIFDDNYRKSIYDLKNNMMIGRWYTAPTRGVRMIFKAGPEYQGEGFDMQFKCERGYR